METPFNMLIVGMTACGKTHYLLNMLESDYKGHFEYIVLICPTFVWNRTYGGWKYLGDPDFFTIQCDHKQVNRVLRRISKIFRGTNTLIVLDDCASSQDVIKTV